MLLLNRFPHLPASWLAGSWLLVPLLLAPFIATSACRSKGCSPVLEQSSLAALEIESEEALESLRRAHELYAEDPEAAQRSAMVAQIHLERLRDFYLPVAQARGHAYNAYRQVLLESPAKASAELDTVEEILLGMAEGAGHHLTMVLQRPLELLVDARADLAGDPNDAPEAIEQLALELNHMVVKGRLMLGD